MCIRDRYDIRTVTGLNQSLVVRVVDFQGDPVDRIPRFILLDKEGKIINAKMTRPSNPETAKTFDALEGI